MNSSSCSCFVLVWCLILSSVAAGSCNRNDKVVQMCYGGKVSGSTVHLETDITAIDNIRSCTCRAVLKNASAINETRFVTSQLFPWPTCNYRLDLSSKGITVRIERGSKLPSTFLLKNNQEILIHLEKDKCKEKSINACSHIEISETSEDAEIELFCFQYLKEKKPTKADNEDGEGETTPLFPATTSDTTSVNTPTPVTTTEIATSTVPIIHSNLETPHTFRNTSIYVRSDNSTNSSKFILHTKHLDGKDTITTTTASRVNTVFLTNQINVEDVEKIPPSKSQYSQTLRVGVIIAVVIAILLLGLLGVMLGYFYRRSRRKAASLTNLSNRSLVTHYVTSHCYVPYTIPQHYPVMRSCSSSALNMGSNIYHNERTY